MKLRYLLIAFATALPLRGLARGVLILAGVLLAFSPRLAFCQFEINCGDGQVQSVEQCDPGTGPTPDPLRAAASSPTCDADCTIAECGDGFTNPAAGEECDGGNDPNDRGCNEFCMLEGEEVAGGLVGPGGTVTTDTESGGNGATASDPVETTVTTPTGGNISILEGDIMMGAVPAFSFFGQEVTPTDCLPSAPVRFLFATSSAISTISF